MSKSELEPFDLFAKGRVFRSINRAYCLLVTSRALKDHSDILCCIAKTEIIYNGIRIQIPIIEYLSSIRRYPLQDFERTRATFTEPFGIVC